MKNSFISALVCTSALTLTSISSFAGDQVQVGASRDLRIAVIETGRKDISTPALHAAFAGCLSTSIGSFYGSPLPVQVAESSLPQCAFELSMGSHDAVLVIGPELPSVFRKSEYSTVRVVPQMGVPARTFHLVIRNDDADFKKAISAAFEAAIEAPRFQESFTKAVAIRVTVDPVSAVAGK